MLCPRSRALRTPTRPGILQNALRRDPALHLGVLRLLPPRLLPGGIPQRRRLYASLALSSLQQGGLSRLMRAPWISDLAQYCLVCGRWHASSHTIKIHMRHIHPDLFLHSEQATRIATRVAGAFSPCLYCAQLWQVCVFALLHGHGPDSGGRIHGGVVRTRPGQAPDPSHVAAQGRGHGTAGQSRQAQCRRQGTGSGQSGPRFERAQSTLSGLWRGVRPAAAGQPEKSRRTPSSWSLGYSCISRNPYRRFA